MPPPRKTVPRESRLLSEFLAQFYPTARIFTHVRVGTPPLLGPTDSLDPQERALLKNFARWADALIVEPSGAMLVEAEIVPTPGVISQLELYRELFLRDPDWSAYHGQRIGMLLVWAFDDPAVHRMAVSRGLAVRIYSPPWVVDSLRAGFSHHLRSTRPPRPAIEVDLVG